LTRRATAFTIKAIAEAIIKILDPASLHPGPHVVICWDESHSLIEAVPNARWTIFSQLRRALRTIRDVSFISIFLSTTGKFHYFSPSPEFETSARLMYEELRMLPPITEVGFDQFAQMVDYVNEEWTLERIASTHQMVHYGRAL
jgi:hypothetical protein